MPNLLSGVRQNKAFLDFIPDLWGLLDMKSDTQESLPTTKLVNAVWSVV